MSNIDEIKQLAQMKKKEEYGYAISELINNKVLTQKEAVKLKKDFEKYNVIIWKGYTFIRLGENIGIYDYYTRRFAEVKIVQELAEGNRPLFNLAEVPYMLKQYQNMEMHYKIEERDLFEEYIKHIMGKNEFEYSEANMEIVNSFLEKIFENTENIDLNIVLGIIKYNKSNYKNQNTYELRSNILTNISNYLKEIKTNKANEELRILYNCKNPTKQKTYLHDEQAYKARKFADVKVGFIRRFLWDFQDAVEDEFKNKEAITVYRDGVKIDKKAEFEKLIKVEEVNPYTTDINELRRNLEKYEKDENEKEK